MATAQFLKNKNSNGTAYVIGESGLFTPLQENGYILTNANPDEVIPGKYGIEPGCGAIELGDPRVRTAQGLQELVAKSFVDAEINITPVLHRLNSTPDILTREAAGFFYASFVLSEDDHRKMLNDLENHFTAYSQDGDSCFVMPVNRLVIRLTK